MEENNEIVVKKNNSGLIVILLLLVIGLTCYIVYDKVLNKDAVDDNPTVNEDTTAVKKIAIKGVSNSWTTKEVVMAPDMIPHISPITSLHMLLALFPFLIKLMHSLDPVIFLEALAWNVFSSQLNTATPIISKNIPINININNTNPKNKTFIFVARVPRLANMNDNTKVSTNMIRVHKSFFIFSPFNF